MIFEASQPIWWRPQAEEDEYGDFYATYPANTDGQAIFCRLCVDGDYALYVNGNYVSSNPYDDYPHRKHYDTLDLSAYTQAGINHFAVRVWHFGGTNHFSYAPAKTAFLIFEVMTGGQYLLTSGQAILSRKSLAYESGRKKPITMQLGYSYRYDANREDNWQLGEGLGFAPSAVIAVSCDFAPRPVEKLQLLPETPFRLLKAEENGNHYLLDLSAETVGLFTMRLTAAKETEICIAYGEHIEDGGVRRRIADRDFSFTYRAKPGNNTFLNPFLRIGARYLEIESENPITLDYAGLIPQQYPVRRKTYAFEHETDKAIFETSVKTLELCMLEHYVDCPWREQGLYVLDSRDQMLYGYDAFENGNAAYVRANLALMAQDNRTDGLTSICFPTAFDLTIPSFTLYWFMSTREYVEKTGDLSLVKEIYPKLTTILETFRSHKKEGLLCQFRGKAYWNFYDWTPYADYDLGHPEDSIPDLILNCLYVLALSSYQFLSEKIGQPAALSAEIDEMTAAIQAAFWREEDDAFSHIKGQPLYHQLGNALAIRALPLPQEKVKRIANSLLRPDRIPCSLSMRCFVYDALLAADEARYRPFILDELRRDFSHMLSQGATSFWETMDGAEAFDKAGSLCHGWSALPIHYFVRFGVAKEVSS